MRNLIHLLTAFVVVATAVGKNVYAQSGEPDLKSEIEVRGVYLMPSGETSFSSTQTPGTIISFSRDFDLPNRLGLDLSYTYRSENGKHKFKVDYSRSSYSSTRTLTRTIEFFNQTYTANLQIDTERKLQDFGAMYAYRWGNKQIRIGPMVSLGFVKPSVSIVAASNSGLRATEGSITTFAALIGYDLDYSPVSKVSIFNNVGGIVYHRQRLFHAEGGLKYFPAQHFGVSGGYKFVNYKVVDGVNFIRAREHGPFFGGLLRF